jgi:hypothetical protein
MSNRWRELAVLLPSLAITWTLLAVIIGVEANVRGFSGFGWASLALLISPFLAGCILIVLARTRREGCGENRTAQQRNVEQTKGAILGAITHSLGEVIRCAPIETPQPNGPRIESKFLPWLAEIFTRMDQSAAPSLSAPNPRAPPELAAINYRGDFEPNGPDHLEVELVKAIGELVRAAETVDRLKSELADRFGGKPHRRDRLEPIVGGRPLYGRLIRVVVFVEPNTAVTVSAAALDGERSAKIISGTSSITGRYTLAGEREYKSRCA